MNDFWGRPGAGAPNMQGPKKAQLDDILYSPRKQVNMGAVYILYKVHLFVIKAGREFSKILKLIKCLWLKSDS